MSRLTCQSLHFSYGREEVLKDVSLDIPEGKTTIILGPNGSGKSTLLKVISRILPPSSGEVFLDQENINSYHSTEIAKKMAFIPQHPEAPEGLTVEELVWFGRFPHKKKFEKKNAVYLYK